MPHPKTPHTKSRPKTPADIAGEKMVQF